MAIKAKIGFMKQITLPEKTAVNLEKMGKKKGFTYLKNFIEEILSEVEKTGKFDIDTFSNNK